MPPTKLQILKMKVTKFRDRLASQPPKEKQNLITLSFAQRFNELLDDLALEEPTLATDLPSKIEIHDSGTMGYFPENTEFIQIEILTEQIIGLIELYDDHR